MTELGWVREYSDWTIDVYDDEFDSPPGQELVDACRERLEEVGPPPTSRLEPAWERAAAVCPLLSEKGSVRRAKDVVEDADDLVVPLFIDSKELVLGGSATDRSRADLRLSALASTAVDISQEVRCWSDEDWRRLVREDNAWSVESDDPDELYGWQDGDTDRIHMRVDQCNLLHRLGREDMLRWKRDDQIEAADSLATFVARDPARAPAGRGRGRGRVFRRRGAGTVRAPLGRHGRRGAAARRSSTSRTCARSSTDEYPPPATSRRLAADVAHLDPRQLGGPIGADLRVAIGAPASRRRRPRREARRRSRRSGGVRADRCRGSRTGT